MKYSTLLTLVLISLILGACQQGSPKQEDSVEPVEASLVTNATSPSADLENANERDLETITTASTPSPRPTQALYDVDNISETINLPRELTEISGLSYDEVNNRFVANNDEKGTIYHVNLDGTIASKVTFGKDADYEAIELVRDDIVVAKSNGNLYFYDPVSTQTTKIKSELSSKNDIEGLTFDSDNNLLLLACKGQTLNEENKKKEKVVYAYNLELEVLHKEPFLIMGDPEHLSFVEYHYNDLSKYRKNLLQKRIKGFSPSGIAINPINKDLYVVSARGSLIVIYDIDHELKDVLFFDEGRVPQPEGICFNPNGDMYVSTEGKGLTAKIFKFDLVQ